MAHNNEKSWRCRLGFHRWHRVFDHERWLELKECRLCGQRLGLGIPPYTGGGAG